jgi:hypothetical protein
MGYQQISVVRLHSRIQVETTNLSLKALRMRSTWSSRWSAEAWRFSSFSRSSSDAWFDVCAREGVADAGAGVEEDGAAGTGAGVEEDVGGEGIGVLNAGICQCLFLIRVASECDVTTRSCLNHSPMAVLNRV